MNIDNARKVPVDAPIGFIKKRWERLVMTDSGGEPRPRCQPVRDHKRGKVVVGAMQQAPADRVLQLKQRGGRVCILLPLQRGLGDGRFFHQDVERRHECVPFDQRRNRPETL